MNVKTQLMFRFRELSKNNRDLDSKQNDLVRHHDAANELSPVIGEAILRYKQEIAGQQAVIRQEMNEILAKYGKLSTRKERRQGVVNGLFRNKYEYDEYFA